MRVNRSSPDKRTADGITFASIVEMDHYLKLKALQSRGVITKLQHEPKFVFVVNDVTIGTFKPDFTFLDEHGLVHIQDCKGWKKSAKTGKLLPRVDREFHLVKNLMLALFGLEIELV